MDKSRIKDIVREVLGEIKINDPNDKISDYSIKIDSLDKFNETVKLLKQKGFHHGIHGEIKPYNKYPFWIIVIRWDKDYTSYKRSQTP